MNIALAICTVSCVSWIITREQIFAPLRAWAKGKKGLYPIGCVFCLIPWTTGLVFLIRGLPLEWYFPVVWAAYFNVAVFAKVRG